MGITVKIMGLILIPFAVVWTMNPGERGMCKPAAPQRMAFFPICEVHHGYEKAVLLHLKCSQANLGEDFIVRIWERWNLRS